MAGYLSATSTDSAFRGVRRIYQYVNDDGANKVTVCGQAACATLLTYCGAQFEGIDTLRKIEKTHSPDLLGGRLGTTPIQILKILSSYGARCLELVNDVASLKKWVAAHCPVICLIQNTAGPSGAFGSDHWFVVFGYDTKSVFVTNYGSPSVLSWADFTAKWDSPVPNLSKTLLCKGITTRSRIIPDAMPIPSNLA